MARKSHEDALGVAGAETVIGTGVVVRGNLTSESDIVIDGTLNGSVTTAGNVTVGMNAQIKGNIVATNANISGLLRGNITTDGIASIFETGHVEGDIKSAGLVVASGAVFIGQSVMQAPPRLEPENTDEEPAVKQKKTAKDHEA